MTIYFSLDYNKRMSEYKVGCAYHHYKFEYLLYVDDRETVEKQIKNHLDEYKINGEWYYTSIDEAIEVFLHYGSPFNGRAGVRL